jgi:protein TonB
MSSKEQAAESRGLGKRTSGFIAVSLLVHLGVLVALASNAKLKGNAETPAKVEGKGSADTVSMTEVPPAALPAAEPVEVATVTEVTDGPEVAPIKAAKVEVAPLPEKAPAKKAAPAPVAKEKPAPKPAPKVAAKKAAPAPAKVITDDSSVTAAVAKAREEDKPALEPATEAEDAPQAMAPIEVVDDQAAPTEAPAAATAVESTTSGTTTEAAPAAPAEPEAQPATEAPAADQKAVPAAAPVSTAAATAPAAKTVEQVPAAKPGPIAAQAVAAAPAAQQGPTTAGTSSGNGVNGTTGGGAVGVAAIPAVRESTQLRPMPGNPKPTYPQQDRLLKRQGTAVLKAYIKNDGSVGQVLLEQSSGSPLMDEAAVNTYKRWRYYPGQEGPVRHRIAFQLTGDAQTSRAHLRTRN